jgi:hypothetical protein
MSEKVKSYISRERKGELDVGTESDLDDLNLPSRDAGKLLIGGASLQHR